MEHNKQLILSYFEKDTVLQEGVERGNNYLRVYLKYESQYNNFVFNFYESLFRCRNGNTISYTPNKFLTFNIPLDQFIHFITYGLVKENKEADEAFSVLRAVVKKEILEQ